MPIVKALIAQLSSFLHSVWRHVAKHALFYLAFVITLFLFDFAVHDRPSARVVLEMQAQQRDVFQFFYKPVEDPDFTETNSMKRLMGIKKEIQTLSFEIPHDCNLENVRLDVGSNRQQDSVRLDHVWLIYKKDTLLLFDGTRNFFVTNDNVERVGNCLRLHATVNGAYDPYLLSGDLTMDYFNLTVNKNKLPGFLLLPFVVALLLRFIIFTRHNTFLSSFYVAAPCLFVLLLLLPVLNNLFDLGKGKNREKRVLAEMPGFVPGKVLEYLGEFERYFNDNFGFRSQLVSYGGKIKYYLFGASAAPASTSVGRDGWMYLTGPFYLLTSDAEKGGNLFADTSIHRMVREWEERKLLLAKDGIHYYKAFWPEKHTIYKEYLPLHMRAIIRDTLLRLDQVLSYMKKKNSDLHLVDVTEELQKEKEAKQLYFKYDSHWNASGAFIAYTALMKQVAIDFPQLKPHPLSDYTIRYESKTGGDLADMLDIEEKEMIPVYHLKNDSSRVKELPFFNYPPNTFIYENRSAATNLSLLVYRDSYTTELIPFLQPHFRSIILLWGQTFSPDFVKTVKPDIVIESNVSRFIGRK